MIRYAIIRADGYVASLVLCDPAKVIPAPANHAIIRIPEGSTIQVGDTVDGADLTRRISPPGERERLLAQLRAEVNAERARRLEDMTVVVDGIPFDADAESRNNLSGLLHLLPPGATVNWRCADNEVRLLSDTQVRTAAAAIAAAVQGLYGKSWQLKDVTLPAMGLEELAGCSVGDDRFWA